MEEFNEYLSTSSILKLIIKPNVLYNIKKSFEKLLTILNLTDIIELKLVFNNYDVSNIFSEYIAHKLTLQKFYYNSIIRNETIQKPVLLFKDLKNRCIIIEKVEFKKIKFENDVFSYNIY